MLMADKLLPKTWGVVERTADRYRLKTTVIATESAFIEKETGLVIGHCKAIIESLCKSILDERGKEYDSNSSVGKLAKQAVTALEVGKGAENEKKAREAFKRLVTGFANNLETAVQGIGELRNDFCPLAHGKSNAHVPLDLHYAEFLAKQADSLVGFIYELKESYLLLEPESPIISDADFDEYLNDEFDAVEIYEDTYLPSEILFSVKPEKYKEALDEYNENKEVS